MSLLLLLLVAGWRCCLLLARVAAAAAAEGGPSLMSLPGWLLRLALFYLPMCGWRWLGSRLCCITGRALVCGWSIIYAASGPRSFPTRALVEQELLGMLG